MQKAPQQKRWYQRFDKWSSRLMIGLFVVGLLFVIVDVGLIAAIVLQNRGVQLAWLFAPQPTPVIEPTMWISPEAGEPGTAITVAGRGWQAYDPLVVELDDPWGAACQGQVLATVEAAEDGRLNAPVTYPSGECWSALSRAQITVRSLQTAKRASAGFQVLPVLHTPTPTLVVEPTVTPTETPPPAPDTPTPTVEPTPTLIPPPATPTPTPTATPTSTPTPTPVPPTATPTPVPPTATPTPVITDWRGEYWPNMSLSGNPALVRNDKNIAFDWRQGSPSSAIPADTFSARWTRQVAFEAGTVRFHALVDDGVRMWVNDRLIIDAWSDHNAVELTADYVLAKGTYALKVEYYERIGNARIQVWWEKVQPSYPDWKGEYWPNRELRGPIALVRNDRAPDGTPGLDFNWGPNAPASALPADNFSVRWTRQAEFEATTYRFHALADDGVRLWVDGVLLIDQWRDQQPREWTADRAMVAGRRTIVVEYYEHTGGARIQVWWEKIALSFPDWKGEYWPNRDLNGSPVLLRNDKGPGGTLGLEFDWGTGAPAPGLPADNFSARWTRQVTFDPGIYRLQARADDGVRVYVDGRPVLDEWHDYRDQTYTVDMPMGGAHQLEVHYYERGGGARIRFSWQRIGDLPTPTPVPLPSVSLSSATYTVSEGAQSATITVVLNRAHNQPVTVDYATAGGTASSGSDYIPVSGRLTFEPGITSRTFAVSIIDDTEDEADETVVLALSNPGNATLGATYLATLIIVDNDEPLPVPYVQFGADTYSVDEGAEVATIAVLLSSAYDRPVTVSYRAAGGTADVGSDYETVLGTLTFQPGVTEQTFIVRIINDQQDEEDETIVLRLTDATNAVMGEPSQAILVIVDDDTVAPPAE